MKIEKIQGFRSIDSNADKINELVDAATEHELKIASLYDQLNGFRAVMRKNGWDVNETYPIPQKIKSTEEEHFRKAYEEVVKPMLMPEQDDKDTQIKALTNKIRYADRLLKELETNIDHMLLTQIRDAICYIIRIL